MNLSNLRPFPVSVVAMGPGSQETDSPEFMPMPRDMRTFDAPRVPEGASQAAIVEAADRLQAWENNLRTQGWANDPGLPLMGLSAEVRQVLTEAMGFGEVSAFTVGDVEWRVQETAFAGLWRVLAVQGESLLEDHLEASLIPAVLPDVMRATASEDLPAPTYPPGVMNAQALVEEVREQAARWKTGEDAHVINLTQLPVNDADLDLLYAWLGHREVSILSRGYGNCRITSTRLQNVWWVQYFNSMDTLILNAIEVVDMPNAALASEHDIEDSLERLAEYLNLMVETD